LYGFFMDMEYKWDNAFPNFKCMPEPFFLEKSTDNKGSNNVENYNYYI